MNREFAFSDSWPEQKAAYTLLLTFFFLCKERKTRPKKKETKSETKRKSDKLYF